MDIFTTQLTRVVQTPIKRESIKVKALLKEAANSKLDQDPDHLENHKYYLTREEQSSEHKQPKHKKLKQDVSQCGEKKHGNKQTDTNIEVDDDEIIYEKHGSEVCVEKKHDDDDDTKHLDLYA